MRHRKHWFRKYRKSLKRRNLQYPTRIITYPTKKGKSMHTHASEIRIAKVKSRHDMNSDHRRYTLRSRQKKLS